MNGVKQDRASQFREQFRSAFCKSSPVTTVDKIDEELSREASDLAFSPG
jgi:hypothetical protein